MTQEKAGEIQTKNTQTNNNSIDLWVDRCRLESAST